MSGRVERLDDGRVRVTLDKPVQTADGARDAVILKVPTYGDFMDLGDPTTLVFGSGGNALVPSDDMVTIKAYVERLSDVSPEALRAQGSLPDARNMVAGVKMFFRDITPGN